ncbi:MAG: Coenzyme PQQ synthesis protein E [Candidatus Argoarchaeum ethanivorans]|uniref:Coenzyme PQQ synthesis protein E n=1 Tax=Candidatus Argoarchaeum ethanivorans TaxID=2608793 RepID=A0A811T9M3_9EURY|nr:MAG: Coenzyme PQQ synthesis protein E [Candidatus Argoarchaeum ethanivorans]
MIEVISEEGHGSHYFTLQWHLTAKCDQHCKHCYMYDSPTYEQEVRNELKYETCLNIIDDFSNAIDHWGISGRINFTGGDPLLKERVFDIIEYARRKSIAVGILGNPNHLDYKTAKKLKDLGVIRYQISIDGMEETHDSLRRKKGAFEDAIRAINVLNDVGIPSVVMFTLSKINANELIDVIRLVAKEGVSIFDFARMVPIGSSMKLKEQMLSPQEYRALLLRVLEEYKRLQENGTKTHYGRKENLWTLLYHELGLIKPLPKDKETIYPGCAIGCSILTILADGTVLACRRLPLAIGNVPNQSIREIFIHSKEHNRMRQVEGMKKCGRCELLQFCRGCPAVAYGVHGDYMAEDPQCWKGVQDASH